MEDSHPLNQLQGPLNNAETPHDDLAEQTTGRLERADAVLRRIEARLATILNLVPVGVAVLDAEEAILLVNDRFCEIVSRSRAELQKLRLPELTHPEDRPTDEVLFRRLLVERRPFATQQQLLGPNGSSVWVHKSASLVPRDGEHPPQVVIVVEDITDRKAAEVEHRDLLRRLVTAQEDERSRIARELHDQLGQYITALALGLKLLQSHLAEDEEARESLEHLHQLTEAAGQEMHQIANELHPALLDDMGLYNALDAHLEEWSLRFGIPVDFQGSGTRALLLPAELSTTVFRVVQEGLTNVVRHAQAQHVSVVLERHGSDLIAIVDDDGLGIRLSEDGKSPEGFGLRSARERALMVGGTLTLERGPRRGSTLILRVPLPAQVAGEGGGREETPHSARG